MLNVILHYLINVFFVFLDVWVLQQFVFVYENFVKKFQKSYNNLLYICVCNFLQLKSLIEISIIYIYTSFWIFLLDKNMKLGFLDFLFWRTLPLFLISLFVVFLVCFFFLIKENTNFNLNALLHLLSFLLSTLLALFSNKAYAGNGEFPIEPESSDSKPFDKAFFAALDNNLEEFNRIMKEHKMRLLVMNTNVDFKNIKAHDHSFLHQVLQTTIMGQNSKVYPAATKAFVWQEVVNISTAPYLSVSQANSFLDDNKDPLVYKVSANDVFRISNQLEERTIILNEDAQEFLNTYRYAGKYLRQADPNLDKLLIGGDVVFTSKGLDISTVVEFKKVDKAIQPHEVDNKFRSLFSESPHLDKSLIDFKKKILYFKQANSDTYYQFDLHKMKNELNNHFLEHQFKMGQHIATKRLHQLPLQANVTNHCFRNILRNFPIIKH